MDGPRRGWKSREWGSGGKAISIVFLDRHNNGRDNILSGLKRKRELTPEKPSLEELLIQFAGNARGFSDFDNTVQEFRDNLLTEYETQGIDVKELLTKWQA
ncbi:hypothetical protein TTRE_0000622101 [Trichuris trichiura]|uniref:Uncharacterized protein n=1 Tax=Trichuris trichiura TaxID=36087 RepID=A0A077ZC03_TRITR|nr:hypothetical protein TTRE_0000622101 [Trichuris trichiura]